MERARFLPRRTGLTAGIAAALMVLVGIGTGTAGAAASARVSLSGTLSAPSVATGTAVTFSGRLKSAKSRTVHLQQQTGKTWTTLGKTTASKKTGAYSISVSTATAGTFVLRASGTKSHGVTPVSSKRTLVVTAAVLPPCCKTNPTPTPTATTKPTPTPGPGAAKASFRAVYALAADQSADPGKGAAIANDIAAIDGWFATQTNNNVQPRWIRDGSGAVPITTVTLPRAAAAYATATFGSVVAEVNAQSPTPANEKTVVWLNVKSPDGCAVTGSDMSIVFEDACNIHPSTSDTWPYGATYVTAHEMTHNFGAVASCAPHEGNGNHVIDDPRDVLYAGASARDWAHITLDPGHDDYYDTGRADCPGIESSPYWTATSDPMS